MTKMQAAALLLAGALTIGLSGCRAVSTLLGQSTEPTDPKTGYKIDPTPWTSPAPEEETTFAFGEPITVCVFPDDVVSVTVNGVTFFPSFEAAGVDPQDEKRVNLNSQTEYTVNRDGSLTEGTQIAMVDMTVTALVSPHEPNMTADSENEHMMSADLTYNRNVTCVDFFYFDFEETDAIHRSDKITGYRHYWLPEGESVDMKLGFLLSKRNFFEQTVYLTFRGDRADTDKRQFVLLHKGESA